MVQFAEWIDEAVRQPREVLRNSVLGHEEAFEELWEIWDECRIADWDGYGAPPIEQATYHSAYTLIESLPLGFPRPSISAQPDGQLTLEWYRSPTRTLSIGIDPDGLIHYAGLIGAEQHFGTVPLLDGIPNRILRLASEI